uniref:Uncharacterized protein n=1 Tax=Opuntia streptacantha TaxID=393608 RepID=A0A7C8Z1N4_OPUST
MPPVSTALPPQPGTSPSALYPPTASAALRRPPPHFWPFRSAKSSEEHHSVGPSRPSTAPCRRVAPAAPPRRRTRPISTSEPPSSETPATCTLLFRRTSPPKIRLVSELGVFHPDRRLCRRSRSIPVPRRIIAPSQSGRSSP